MTSNYDDFILLYLCTSIFYNIITQQYFFICLYTVDYIKLFINVIVLDLAKLTGPVRSNGSLLMVHDNVAYSDGEDWINWTPKQELVFRKKWKNSTLCKKAFALHCGNTD